ncbi:MAG TPA: CYTH and CHAD domain-containing protein [Amnibacterium sp.]
MGAASHAEIEVKYAVDERAVLPDLAAVPGATAVERFDPVRLEAVYFDTADRVLVRARIALRRRTGGHDAGWHVKLPAAVGRTELQAPIDPAAPDALPAAIRQLVASRVRTAALEPIARIATERTAVVLHDASGAGAVEVVDDRVTATDIAAGVVRTWREWEVEQVGDDADASAALLEAADPVLQAAGARVSPSPAKLAQALGGERIEQPGPATTAGEVVRRVVARLTEQLHRDVAALVSGGPDEVHAARKTIRRLRSVLALEDVTGEAGASLRERLRPLGATLGDARDPVVGSRVAADLLADVDDVPEAVRRRLVDDRLEEAEAARVRAVGALGSPADLAVFADLDAFAAADPAGPRADAPVPVLADLARSTVRRAVRRTRRADRSIEALHDARKAAKRARYVIEELDAEGALRSRSALRRAARRASAVHDAIGAHRDLELVVADLPFVAARAAANGENAFVYGVLAERGARRARGLRRRAARAMQRLRSATR